jgi:serine/threonine-protein kinase RsbW
MTRDRVTLTIPAKGEYAKTVRMAASALGARMGMSYDDVEDLKMAVDEAFIYAVDTLSPEAEVMMFFDVNEHALEVSVHVGRSEECADEDGEAREEFATFILDSVCETHDFVSHEDGSRTLRIVCRCGSVDVDQP